MAERTGTRAEERLEPQPPVRRLTALQWARENLFNTWYNGVLTVVFGALILFGLVMAARFVFVTGRWEVIRRNLTLLLVERFPRDELWRPWVAAYILAASFGLFFGASAAARRDDPARPPAPFTPASVARRMWPLGLFAAVLLALSSGLAPILLVIGLFGAALAGRLGGERLPRWLVRWRVLLIALGGTAAFEVLSAFGGESWDRWGGMMLLLFLAVGAIVLSFPLGVLLALGRRSRLLAVRVVSTVYIEVIRGVPLITLLFMGAFLLGFFFPLGFPIPSLVIRALIAMTMFTAAYIAEVVRGGLQAIPRGQIEAAQAVGLSPFKVTSLIVLPQALRAVIPALVGQFISLFKDVSLVAIIGLAEVLNVAQRITQQADFRAQGLQAEVLVFASFVYWVGAYWMSKESQRLEKRLGVGER